MATVAQINGVVLNEFDNTPIANVNIAVVEHSSGTSTSVEGRFELAVTSFPTIISISALGYEPQTLEFDKPNTELVIYLTPSRISIEEIVVAATRWWQRSSEVPTKITSITMPQITFHSPQTSADLLATSGQVFIQKSQQGGGSPMIRGFATNRLLYSVDGIRMNTAIFRAGNIQNVINIDPFTIEKTEVAFGPGSVLYGSDAIGGVMSFQTITPNITHSDSLQVSGKLVSRFSSANNERTGHFDLNLGWEKFGSVTSFTYWDFDHLRQGSHGPDDYVKDYYVVRQNGQDVVVTQEDYLEQIPTAYTQINLMQKIRYQPVEDWDFQYGLQYSETSKYGRYDRHNRVSNDNTARYAEWDYGPQLWLMNNIQISHSAPTILYDEMITRLAYQKFEESRIDRALNSDTRSIYAEMVDAYSINLDFNKKTSKRNKVFYGAEYVYNDVTSTGEEENITTGITETGPSRYPQASWQSIGIFVQDEFKLTEKATVNAGIRYNKYLIDSRFDTTFYPFPFTEAHLNNGSVTGSLGTVFRPSKSLLINASIGTGFRAPNVDDIGKVFDSEPGSVVVPNPDLKAEYAYNAELGVANVFNDVIKAEITGFYTLLNNALVRRDYELNGATTMEYAGVTSTVQAIQNAAVASVYGLQASFNIVLPSNFNFTTDLNFQKGEEEMDDGTKSASRHAAPFFGVSRLGYKVDDLQIIFYVDFQGEKSFEDLSVDEQSKDEIYAKDENGNNYSPAWATMNLKTFYEITDQISISAGLENIADVRYRPYSSGISGAGRNFFISLRTNI